MKLLIINDERQPIHSQIERYSTLVPPKDIFALAYLPPAFYSWESYLRAGIEVLKGKDEKLIIFLDKFLIRQDKWGQPIRNKLDNIVEESSFSLFVQLIKEGILTNEDIIVCDSSDRKQQFDEFNNFGMIDLEKGEISYTQEERGDIGIVTINGIRVLCEIKNDYSQSEKSKDKIKEFLLPELKSFGSEIKSEINNI